MDSRDIEVAVELLSVKLKEHNEHRLLTASDEALQNNKQGLRDATKKQIRFLEDRKEDLLELRMQAKLQCRREPDVAPLALQTVERELDKLEMELSRLDRRLAYERVT